MWGEFMTSNTLLPVYHSRDYWLASPEVRELVDEEFHEGRKRDLDRRLNLARTDADLYLRTYASPYAGRF